MKITIVSFQKNRSVEIEAADRGLSGEQRNRVALHRRGSNLLVVRLRKLSAAAGLDGLVDVLLSGIGLGFEDKGFLALRVNLKGRVQVSHSLIRPPAQQLYLCQS